MIYLAFRDLVFFTFTFTEVQAILSDLEIKRNQAKERLLDLEDEYLKTEKDMGVKDEKLKRAEHCLKLVEKKINRKEKELYDVSCRNKNTGLFHAGSILCIVTLFQKLKNNTLKIASPFFPVATAVAIVF
jgi:hypothetical protein